MLGHKDAMCICRQDMGNIIEQTTSEYDILFSTTILHLLSFLHTNLILRHDDFIHRNAIYQGKESMLEGRKYERGKLQRHHGIPKED